MHQCDVLDAKYKDPFAVTPLTPRGVRSLTLSL
jgi:hypothetical protein